MVKKAMTFIDKIDNQDDKMKYVQCLREVCEKKIYLEVFWKSYKRSNMLVAYL